MNPHQQTSTFHPFPPQEKIIDRIEMQKRRVAGPVSYLLYIMPVAERFGDQVYEVAAKALQDCGVDVTAERLKAVAAELATPEGQARYEQDKWEHIWSITPIRQKGESW